MLMDRELELRVKLRKSIQNLLDGLIMGDCNVELLFPAHLSKKDSFTVSHDSVFVLWQFFFRGQWREGVVPLALPVVGVHLQDAILASCLHKGVQGLKVGLCSLPVASVSIEVWSFGAFHRQQCVNIRDSTAI